MTTFRFDPPIPVQAGETFEMTLTIRLPPEQAREVLHVIGTSGGPYPRREIDWTSVTSRAPGESGADAGT